MAIVLVSCVLAGCGGVDAHIVRSDGWPLLQGSPPDPEGGTDKAAIRRASRDIPCDPAMVRVVSKGTVHSSNYDGRLVVAEGCGARLSFSESCPLVSMVPPRVDCNLIVIARISTAADSPASTK